MQTKTTITSNEEIYGDFRLVPLPLDAVNQRIEFFGTQIALLLNNKDYDSNMLSKYFKHRTFWEGIRDNHCSKDIDEVGV